MRLPVLLLTALAAALLIPSGVIGAQSDPSPESPPLTDPSSATDAVVRGVFFFSPLCGHCEYVINDELPKIFETWGGGYSVSYDESQPSGDVSFYLMGNDVVQLLMVDTTVAAGAQVFVDDSGRLGIEQAGVPRLDVADAYMVGSVDIPSRFPGVIADGLAAGGIDWPAVEGIEDAVAYFEGAGLLGGGLAAEDGDGAALPATTDSGPLDRVADDPLANGISILVLVALVVSLVAVPVLVMRGSLPAVPAATVPILALVGIGIAAYLAAIETSGSDAVCGPVGDCNAVQQSEYATLLGVPIGVLGVLGYMAIGGLWLVAWRSRGRAADWARLLLAIGAFGGVLFSAYLTFLEPFVIGATCMWCISSAIIMLALLWVTAADGWAAYRRLRGADPDGGRRADTHLSATAGGH